MRLRKVIRKAIRQSGPGGEVAGSINAVVAANVDEPGPARTSVSSRQRVAQRGGRSEPRQTTQGGES
jgi:hypothetical protein